MIVLTLQYHTYHTSSFFDTSAGESSNTARAFFVPAFFHDPSVRSGWPARYGMVPFDTTIFLGNFLL